MLYVPKARKVCIQVGINLKSQSIAGRDNPYPLPIPQRQSKILQKPFPILLCQASTVRLCGPKTPFPDPQCCPKERPHSQCLWLCRWYFRCRDDRLKMAGISNSYTSFLLVFRTCRLVHVSRAAFSPTPGSCKYFAAFPGRPPPKPPPPKPPGGPWPNGGPPPGGPPNPPLGKLPPGLEG